MSTIADPLTLPCGVEIPNRLCKAAMTEGLADAYGRPSDELCNLYRRWSVGGAGLLITGNVQVDRRYVERPGNVAIDGEQDEKQIQLLKNFAAASKSSGSLVFVQLSHGGRQSNGMINMSPVGPGDVRVNLPSAYFGNPTPLSALDIVEIKLRFVHAAVVCKQCGFDGVQIHSAHGYLLSSFLNPLANNRQSLFKDDGYSGSIEQRCKFLLEIIRDIRAAVGPKYPISVKLNSADFQQGGFTIEEAITVAQLLDKEKLDLLEISGGNYESGIFKEAVLASDQGKKESTIKREAYFLDYAVEVKKHLKHTAVMVTGGWRSVENMNKSLGAQDIHMIGLGRPLCGDPDGPKKLLEGVIDRLPSYEDDLMVGHWTLQWVFMLPFKILGAVEMMGKQGWFYRNIFHMGHSGEPNHNIGCFAAFWENMKMEEAWATNMKGDVKCVGSVYKGSGME